MSKGSKVISSALLGMDMEIVRVNDKSYAVKPPTIARLAGASYFLADIGDARTMGDVLRTITSGAEGLAHALSWFIQGDDSLYEELSKGTMDEIVTALEKCLNLISTETFLRLSALTKNVSTLIAKPKQQGM